MEISEFAKNYHEKMFPDYKSTLAETDPEFIERFDNFAFDEVINQDDLDDKTRLWQFLPHYWAVRVLMSFVPCFLLR